MVMFLKIWRVMDDRGASNDIRKCGMGEIRQMMDEAQRSFDDAIQLQEEGAR